MLLCISVVGVYVCLTKLTNGIGTPRPQVEPQITSLETCNMCTSKCSSN